MAAYKSRAFVRSKYYTPFYLEDASKMDTPL